MTVAKFAIAGAASFMLFACATTPPHTAEHLQKYMDDNHYTAFALPRDNWGGGTVVSFSGGKENIIYFNDQCLNLSGPGDADDIRTANVSLPSSNYTISKTAKVEASLAQGVVEGANLKGAFNDSRVSTIKIALTSPKEYVSSQGTIKNRIKQLIASGNECVDALFEDGAFVIDRVIGVDGFAYTFETEKGQSISLDAGLLNAMSISPSYSASLAGDAALSSDTPRLLGYRLFRYEVKAGLGETNVIETRISPAEISALLGQ